MTRCVVLPCVPIEIGITVADRPAIYMAGIVAHCRYTQRGFHEVGVALKAHQNQPVFSDDPVRALVTTPWLQRAIQNLRLATQTGKTQTLSPA